MVSVDSTTSHAHQHAAGARSCPPRIAGRGGKDVRPTGFDRTIYRRPNEVEPTINRFKTFRAVATRYDQRACVFHGALTVAAIRLWLRP